MSNKELPQKHIHIKIDEMIKGWEITWERDGLVGKWGCRDFSDVLDTLRWKSKIESVEVKKA